MINTRQEITTSHTHTEIKQKGEATGKINVSIKNGLESCQKRIPGFKKCTKQHGHVLPDMTS